MKRCIIFLLFSLLCTSLFADEAVLKKLKGFALDDKITIDQYKEARKLILTPAGELTKDQAAKKNIYMMVGKGIIAPDKLKQALGNSNSGNQNNANQGNQNNNANVGNNANKGNANVAESLALIQQLETKAAGGDLDSKILLACTYHGVLNGGTPLYKTFFVNQSTKNLFSTYLKLYKAVYTAVLNKKITREQLRLKLKTQATSAASSGSREGCYIIKQYYSYVEKNPTLNSFYAKKLKDAGGLYWDYTSASTESVLTAQALRGNTYAYYSLYYKNRTVNKSKAYEYLKKGADLNDPYCLYSLAGYYSTGWTGVLTKDTAKALEYYKKAAALNHISAYGVLGRAYTGLHASLKPMANDTLGKKYLEYAYDNFAFYSGYDLARYHDPLVKNTSGAKNLAKSINYYLENRSFTTFRSIYKNNSSALSAYPYMKEINDKLLLLEEKKKVLADVNAKLKAAKGNTIFVSSYAPYDIRWHFHFYQFSEGAAKLSSFVTKYEADVKKKIDSYKTLTDAFVKRVDAAVTGKVFTTLNFLAKEIITYKTMGCRDFRLNTLSSKVATALRSLNTYDAKWLREKDKWFDFTGKIDATLMRNRKYNFKIHSLFVCRKTVGTNKAKYVLFDNDYYDITYSIKNGKDNWSYKRSKTVAAYFVAGSSKAVVTKVGYDYWITLYGYYEANRKYDAQKKTTLITRGAWKTGSITMKVDQKFYSTKLQEFFNDIKGLSRK